MEVKNIKILNNKTIITTKTALKKINVWLHRNYNYFQSKLFAVQATWRYEVLPAIWGFNEVTNFSHKLFLRLFIRYSLFAKPTGNDIRIKMTKYENSRFTPGSDDVINHNSIYCSSFPYVIFLLFANFSLGWVYFGEEIEQNRCDFNPHIWSFQWFFALDKHYPYFYVIFLFKNLKLNALFQNTEL